MGQGHKETQVQQDLNEAVAKRDSPICHIVSHRVTFRRGPVLLLGTLERSHTPPVTGHGFRALSL